jgi:hypothetical protein
VISRRKPGFASIDANGSVNSPACNNASPNPASIDAQSAMDSEKQFDLGSWTGLRIPRDADQRSELMSITIPK